LRRIVARLVQQRHLRLDLAARRHEFARQRGTASAFLLERAAMQHGARRQLLSRGGDILRERDRSFTLLFE